MVNASALAVVSVGLQGARGRVISAGQRGRRRGHAVRVDDLTFFRGLP